ncbi:haloacid dehalogenase type II [Maribacter sp.]|nr:haloacid dehalogenase type II [Maribacter sp.]
MKKTLAFDVYGTLIDTSGVFKTLEPIIGPEALSFMEVWRNKQLEYSFRRGLMHAYVDFAVVTKEALEYCCLRFNKKLPKNQIQALMGSYKVLPAFDDVGAALYDLPQENYAKYAFSNGSADAVAGLLKNAKLLDLFEGVVSVERTKMFKPNPLVYRHFNDSTHSEKGNSWLISGNPFDVMGAISYGMKAVWVKRSADAVFDPWGIEPTAVISGLEELSGVLNG